jgi:hypothetical protein
MTEAERRRQATATAIRQEKALVPHFPIGSIVEIDWLDSVSRGRWTARKEIEEWAKGDSPSATHRSVGYLLTRTDRVIVVVQSMVGYGDDGSDEMVAEAQSIPLVAVLAVRQLTRQGDAS